MYCYHRMWLWVLVLSVIATRMCGFANEHVVTENDNLQHDTHLKTQAAVSLKDITESEDSEDLSNELYRSIRFEPPELDFGIWSVGMLRSHTVTLINHNRNRSVYLSSVSGRTPDFSSSFFEAKMVPPHSNTTFNVVFLPRELGVISTILNIHTSFGKLQFLVRGVGQECPYRLKPLVGVRAPLNATLMPEIHMYNPHNEALQILEVYSSGGQFQLELPSGDPEAPKGLWEIPPLTTKPIIRIRFQGYTAGNYSAFIRIKIAERLNSTDSLITGSSTDNNVDGASAEEAEQVYSSGGQFQLELPSGDPEAPKGLWEIPPLTTKPIIRIRFQGYTAGNYSAFIRIKIAERLNSTDSLITGSSTDNNVDGASAEEAEQVLVVPVEFEILPQYGLYAVNPLLEFGHIAVHENNSAKVLKRNIFLKHSKTQLDVSDLEWKLITYITGVYVESSQEIRLHPNELEESVVHLNEKLKIEIQDKQAHTYHSVELIIRADIFKGNLHYDANKTLFLIPTHAKSKLPDENDFGKYDNGSRLITLRNDFQIPLIICNVTTHNNTDKLSLQLESFETGMILKPGLSFDLLVASSLHKQQQEEKDLKDLTNYKTAIYVYTNITNFEIPVIISSASLFVTTQTLTIWRSNSSIYTKELDLGSIPIRETSKDGFVIFQNRNSLPIILNMLDFQKPQGVYYHVLFLGCIKSSQINETNNYTLDLEKADYKFTSRLNEGDVAVYMLDLQPYTTQHNSAFLTLSTLYENITIHIKFSTTLGRLEVDQEKLYFPNCFPGKLCSSELNIRSTFKQPIHIKYINFTDSGLRFEDKNSLGSKIAPQSVTNVGRIYFRPSALCGSRCYIQQQTDESATFPSSIVANSLNIPNFDEAELRRRTELYRHFKYYFQNMDFTMTTKEMQHFQLNLMIELEWPQLVSGRQVLPTIEVNKTHIYEVKISNPSDNPILIDYSLADPTLAKQTRISLPLEVVVITPSCYLTDKAVFALVNPPPKKPILVPGLSSVTIPIKFQADYVGTICTLLHIRNNLTLYEGVWISAKTVQSQFRLGNRKPGSQTPLLFEISEQYLASACPVRQERIRGSMETKQHYIIPQIISRRVFTARNSGELPIRIDGFWIGDQPCQGYGFQVMNCTSFELKANSSKKIEISFQSDFSATRITRPLKLKTNLTYDVIYTLVAQLPSKGLENCELLLPRPPWEVKIHNAAIVMLLITFVLVLVAVHIDFGNIMFHQTALYEARDKGTVHPTFNLRNIATRSMQNTTDSLASVENVQRNRAKLSPNEKNDNSSSPSIMMSLKKRHIKSSKLLNAEAKPISSSTRSSLSLAEMMSWTFGSKSIKKPATANGNKNYKVTDQGNANANNNPNQAPIELKSSKSKLSEKSLLDKMDGDMKRSQNSKKSKVNDKGQTKSNDKSEIEELRLRKDDALDKDLRREKNSPKLQTKTPNLTNSSVEANHNRDNREARKSLDLFTPYDNTDRSPIFPKENSLGRKIGKTPGRERRKQSAQNSSPVISDPTNSSCSSSTSSSCSSNHNKSGKGNERKTKVKASSSLKFSNTSHVSNLFSTSYSASCSPTSMSAANIFKTENTNSPIDILSPWECGNHATFSDVLQKSKSQQKQQSTTSNDLMQQGSIFDLKSSSQNGMDNSEITAALTPKRSKNTATDLGPIGSRKSPSSTPIWEPIQQSAITMQIPRPLNATSTATSSAVSSSATSCYFPMNTNFGYNDLTTNVTTQQPDIHAQLLLLQRQLLEQQHLQQQQQFLNSNALNSNWSHLSSPLWSSPLLANGSANNNNHTSSSIFSSPQSQNSTWSLASSITSSTASSGLVRPPPGLEQNFPLNNNLASTLNNQQTLSSVAATNSATTFNNTTATATAQAANSDNDNMPMFNLFGGLSSIWNDNWKQATTTDQQQSTQNPQ